MTLYYIDNLEDAEKFERMNPDIMWLDGYTMVQVRKVPSTPAVSNAFYRDGQWYVIEHTYELTEQGWHVGLDG